MAGAIIMRGGRKRNRARKHIRVQAVRRLTGAGGGHDGGNAARACEGTCSATATRWARAGSTWAPGRATRRRAAKTSEIESKKEETSSTPGQRMAAAFSESLLSFL